MNKQEILDKAKAIQEVIKMLNANKLTPRQAKSDFQELKNKWEEYCGLYSCGREINIENDEVRICWNCQQQNKEFKEICAEVLE